MNPNPLVWAFRWQYLLGAVLCAALLGYALYEQYEMFLDPCPLCLLQRAAFMVMGLFFLLGGLHAPTRTWPRSIYASGVVIGAMVGVVLAGRHVWLQNLPPDQVPACGSGLWNMLEVIPSKLDVLRRVFAGSGECAEVNWTFLGLSMPAWTLIWYVLLAVFAVRAIRRAA